MFAAHARQHFVPPSHNPLGYTFKLRSNDTIPCPDITFALPIQRKTCIDMIRGLLQKTAASDNECVDKTSAIKKNPDTLGSDRLMQIFLQPRVEDGSPCCYADLTAGLCESEAVMKEDMPHYLNNIVSERVEQGRIESLSPSGNWTSLPLRTGDVKEDFSHDTLSIAHLSYCVVGHVSRIFDTAAGKRFDHLVGRCGVGEKPASETLGDPRLKWLWEQLRWTVNIEAEGPPPEYLELQHLVASLKARCGRKSELHFYRAKSVVRGPRGYDGCTEAWFVQTGYAVLLIINSQSGGRYTTDTVPLLPGRLFVLPPSKRWVLIALSDIGFARAWIWAPNMLSLYMANMWDHNIDQMASRHDANVNVGLPGEDLDDGRLRLAWLALESAIDLHTSEEPMGMSFRSCRREPSRRDVEES